VSSLLCISLFSFFAAGDELISPCMCKGTQQFVHRSCLDHWRSVKVRLISSLQFSCQFLSKHMIYVFAFLCQCYIPLGWYLVVATWRHQY
jgi:hypothetical protein